MRSLAVHRWPGPTPAPQDGLLAILIDTGLASPASGAGPQRDVARRQIRNAACAVLAAVLPMPPAEIAIVSAPGTAPRLLLAGADSSIGISFSHEEGYALAAINLHGPIGADIMRVQDIPDWQAVARDYLGPISAAALQNAANRPLAFTSAWTQREAALKCHALPIGEWQTDLPGIPMTLILPVPNLAGHIHIGDKHA